MSAATPTPTVSAAVVKTTGLDEDVASEIASFTGVPPIQARAIFNLWDKGETTILHTFLETTTHCQKHEKGKYRRACGKVFHETYTKGTRAKDADDDWVYGCRYTQRHEVCQWGQPEKTVQMVHDYE